MLFHNSFASPALVNSSITRSERFQQVFCFGFPIDVMRAQSDLARLDEIRGKNTQALPLDQLLTQCLLEVLAKGGSAREIHMGISSGLDSRLVYAELKRLGVPLPTFTYGQVGNLDFDLICEANDKGITRSRLVDTSTQDWSLALFDEVSADIVDFIPSPRVLAARVIRSERGAYREVHGYLNDSLTGSHIKCVNAPTWMEAIDGFLASNDPFDFQRFADAQRVRNLLPAQPFNSSLDFDHQLDVGIRQPQRIRPSDYADVEFTLPFENDSWRGYWLNQPREKLLNQSQFRRFTSELRSEIFFDLEELRTAGKATDKQQRKERVYGSREVNREALANALGRVAPHGSTQHFCFYAAAKNNSSFRDMVKQSVGRFRKRHIFHNSVVDDIVAKFWAGHAKAANSLKGLVSIDIAAECGKLSRDL